VGLGVRTAGTTRTFSQGDMLNTGNPLDLAIQGQGFFQVQRANGEYAYTRAGNLRADATGRLVTPNGEIVQPGINLPTDATAVTIRPDGSVEATVPGRNQPVGLGTLELTNFQNPAGLSALGNNLYSETAASGEPIRGRPGDNGLGSLTQGYLEGANVKAVEEMVDMISTQRAYELNSKVIQTADQMLQRLTSLR
jgi:flagellar basal-body rod protein FlgG